MPAGQLFLAGVAVIDEHRKSTAILEDAGDALHPGQDDERRLHPLVCVRMNPIAVEKLRFGRRGSDERLDEATVLDADPHCATMIDDFHRQGVKKLISKQDQVVAWSGIGGR